MLLLQKNKKTKNQKNPQKTPNNIIYSIKMWLDKQLLHTWKSAFFTRWIGISPHLIKREESGNLAEM